MTAPAALALCLLAGVLGAAPAPQAFQPPSLREPAFGVLLLSSGPDPDWRPALSSMTLEFAGQFPLEFAAGIDDVKAVQQAADRLTQARVKKLVVVPLFACSHCPLMEETRYLFGLRQDPDPGFFTAGHRPMGYAILRRVQLPARLPVALAPAPDDDPAVAAVLTSRALELSRHPEAEAVVLVGLAPAAAAAEAALPSSAPKAPTAEQDYRGLLDSLAELVRARGGFASAAAAVLRPEAPRQAERQRAEDDLRNLVRSLSRSRRVLVILHAFSGGGVRRDVVRALQGTFMRYNDKGLLPDARLNRWVAEAVRQAAAKPDMRRFKDAGRPLPGSVKPLSVRISGSHS